MTYPRDLVGYGRTPPDPKWPNRARLALQIVMNYEEGGERSILHGDAEAESFLQEVVGGEALRGVRNLQVESIYEYGSRVGFWRLLKLFAERRINISVFAVAMALERHPEAARAIVEAGHEVVSHGWRWIDYQFVSEAIEREHIRLAVDSLTKVTGERPLGWYTGRLSPNTRRLVVEAGGFLYDADAYNDDLPYWVEVNGAPHLRSEEHTSELQSQSNLVCRLLLEKKNNNNIRSQARSGHLHDIGPRVCHCRAGDIRCHRGRHSRCAWAYLTCA